MTIDRVEFYSATSYAERPVAVTCQGQRLEVQEVLRSWRTPDGPGFDVIVADGRKLRLMYDEAFDTWSAFDLTNTLKG